MYRLYGRKGSGSLAPALLLLELGLPHEVNWVSREAAREPAYRAINPTGKVPSLELPDGTIMLESGAMMIHLTQVRPSELAPLPGSSEHARFLQWMFFISSSIYETFLRYYYAPRYASGGEADAPNVKAQAAADLLAQFDLAERTLSPYLLGEKLSAADLYLWMLATWYDPSPDALYQRFPRLAALARKVLERPAVQQVLVEHV